MSLEYDVGSAGLAAMREAGQIGDEESGESGGEDSGSMSPVLRPLGP